MGNYPATNGPLGMYVAGGSETQTKRTLAYYKQGTLLRLRACISFGMPWQVPRGLMWRAFCGLRTLAFHIVQVLVRFAIRGFLFFSFLGEVVPFGAGSGKIMGLFLEHCRELAGRSHIPWPARTGLEARSVYIQYKYVGASARHAGRQTGDLVDVRRSTYCYTKGPRRYVLA